MNKFAAIVVLLPFLVGAFPSGEEESWMQVFRGIGGQEVHPKPCCFPDTWEGFVESNVAKVTSRLSGGKYKVSQTKMAVDGGKKRVAGTMFCRRTGKPVAGFIGLFNETTGVGFKLYAFSKIDTTKCFSFKSAVATYKQTCIPDDAKFKGTFDLGLAGSPLSLNSFSFYKKGKHATLMGNAVVTKDCVPVIYREAGKVGGCKDQSPNEQLTFTPEGEEDVNCGGKKFVVNAFFHNLYPTIKDATIFDLPDACKGKTSDLPLETEEIGDEEFQEAYDEVKNFMNYVVV